MGSQSGISSAVLLSPTLGELLALQEGELLAVDPLVANLAVAKGVPSLGHLDIMRYRKIVNEWTADLTQRCLPAWLPSFQEAPHEFENDERFFLLGMICQYLEQERGIEYNVDQREDAQILYTDPSDLFLNGVVDSGQGTCANLAALHVAIGWRLGLPVSVACLDSHYFLRFDDGRVQYNIEATQSGHGGFKSDPDEYLIETHGLPRIAIECGSDLRALSRREMLGVFIGLRARHFLDVGRLESDELAVMKSESDWLLARQLFPTSRVLYRNQMVVSTVRGNSLFHQDEAGHPATFRGCLRSARSLCTRA